MALSGRGTTWLGLVLLATSLVERHVDVLHSDLAISLSGWGGSILVVVGLGRLMFLED